MIPVIAGLALGGGAIYALSDDDDSAEVWHEVSESDIPPEILRKLKDSTLSEAQRSELLAREGFKQIPASEVPADIIARAKRHKNS